MKVCRTAVTAAWLFTATAAIAQETIIPEGVDPSGAVPEVQSGVPQTGAGVGGSGMGKDEIMAYLANELVALTGNWPFILIVGAVVVFVIFLTELSSNTATTLVFVPIFVAVSIEMNVPVEKLVLPLTIAASCAFMLPIATPPKAIVFGSGKIPQRTMMRVGLALNLCFALILTALSAVLF